jgi:hypothetical protein
VSEAMKHDGGKPRLELIPSSALIELARVLMHGAEKYGDQNWRNGMAWSRLFGAAQRHLWAWNTGEDIDPESGMPHLAHALCNIAFLVAYSVDVMGSDDRFKIKERES